jgi:hypothetical protein
MPGDRDAAKKRNMHVGRIKGKANRRSDDHPCGLPKNQRERRPAWESSSGRRPLAVNPFALVLMRADQIFHVTSQASTHHLSFGSKNRANVMLSSSDYPIICAE